MKTLKVKTWVGSVACLPAVILLLAAHQATAQIRIGPVTVNIPEISKPARAEKPATKVETPVETPATNSGESTTASSAKASPPKPQSDVRLQILLEEIEKRKKEVETYDPAERRQLVTPSTPELFIPAISMRARAAYYKRDKLNATQQAAMNPAFDSLAAAAAKKLPLYKPDAMVFAFHNPPAESMMRQSLRNAATLKIHRSGMKEAVWLLEKNALGLPVDRYKHGFIWARDTSDDHPFCHLYTIFVQQDYAGGGTYGAVFARFSEDEIVGCP